MQFHGSRAEQLADFIRDQIVAGELVNPLPSSRVWCRQLDVGRPNLLRALQILEHAGLLTVTPRGVSINPRAQSTRKKSSRRGHLVVRFLFFGRNYLELQHSAKWLFSVAVALQSRGIRLSLERCSAARLRNIIDQGPHSEELCFLNSLPATYQRQFMEGKKPAVVLGYPGPEIDLPFLTPDLENSVRHATLSLLRRGFKHLILINLTNREVGIAKSIESYKVACSIWPHQPVQADTVLIWNDLRSMRGAIKKIASRVNDRCGFIVFSPVSVSMLATALLERAIAVPSQAEIIAIEHNPEQISLSFPITLYGFPARRFTKAIVTTAVRYFETGKVPVTGKILELDAPRQH